MVEDAPREPFEETCVMLQKQIKEVAEQVQAEIKRLGESPSASTGNAQLYSTLAKQLLKTKEEIADYDHISTLNNAAEKLKKAETQAKAQAKNKEILDNLQAVNAELFKCRNLRK